MIKFRVIDPPYILDQLEDCLEKYSTNDKKVIIYGLNKCGRFLYLFTHSPTDQKRFQQFLVDVEALNEEDKLGLSY